MHPWLLVINSHWKADGVFQLMCDTNFVKSMILCTLICKANKRTHARLRSFHLCLAKVDAFLDLYSTFSYSDYAIVERIDPAVIQIRVPFDCLFRSTDHPILSFFRGFLRFVQHYRWPNGTFKRWDIDRDRSSQTRWNDWIKRENKKKPTNNNKISTRRRIQSKNK